MNSQAHKFEEIPRTCMPFGTITSTFENDDWQNNTTLLSVDNNQTIKAQMTKATSQSMVYICRDLQS